MHLKRVNSKGFTIVETMLAVAVFSLVLLVITSAIIQITKTYYKGITESATQNTANNVLNDISQAIQFGGGGILDTTSITNPTPGTAYNICVGDQRFSFQLGYEVSTNPVASNFQTYHALVADNPVGGCATGTAYNLSSSGIESSAKDLIGPNMRLATLTVVPTVPQFYGANVGSQDTFYKIDVRIVYGDTDLLCSPNPPGMLENVCNNNDTIKSTDSQELADPDLMCKQQSGAQFCSVSEASAVVERRLQ